MLTRISLSIALIAGLAATPLRAATRNCIIYDAPLQKTCKMDCCANKKCCATSPKKTAPASQPLAKTGGSQELSATEPVQQIIPASARSTSREPIRMECAHSAHAPPELAVLCTFLI